MSAYKFIRDEKEERIKEKAKRDWDRHPEIRTEHNGSFEHYIRSLLHNVSHG